MPARSAWTCHTGTIVACLLLALLLLPTLARAQLLDFGSGAPKPGSGANTLALAQSLTDEADRIEREQGADSTSEAAARIALRHLAAAMLTQGEHAGVQGSARIVTARRIAHRLDQLDARLAQLQSTSPAAAEMVRAQATRAQTNIPKDANALDRLTRNIFAPLNPKGPPPPTLGWSPRTPNTPPQPNLSTQIDTWERDSALAEPTITALRTLDQRLDQLERWTVYRPSIDALRQQIRDASTCLDLDPRWIGRESVDALVARFEAALIAAADPAQTDIARDQLHAVTLLTRSIPAARSLTSSTWARPTRDALRETIAGRGWVPADEQRAITLLARAIRQLQQGDQLSDESIVIRQLRPAWRLIIRQRTDAKESVARAFPTMLASPTAETDPAVLAALGAHARTIDDLNLLISASNIMSRAQPSIPTQPNQPIPSPIPSPSPQPLPTRDPTTQPSIPTPLPVRPASHQPVATATWQRPANVFLQLGQQMARPATADDAHAQLRQLARRVVALASLPGEPALDAGDPSWARLLDVPPNELAAAIDAARMQWLLALSRDGPDADAARLLALRDLMQLLDAARFARQNASKTATAPINAWPGWSLSPAAVQGMLTHINARLPRLVTQTIRSDPARAQTALNEAHQHAAALLLFAQLNQHAANAGLNPKPTTTHTNTDANTDAAIWSLAIGPPSDNDTFLSPLRADLARLCRYAEEAFAPPNQTNDTRPNITAARTYTNELATQLLETLADR